MDMQYSLTYSKEYYKDRLSACAGVIDDCFGGEIPYTLLSHINYESLVSSFGIEVVESETKFVALSDRPFDKLSL